MHFYGRYTHKSSRRTEYRHTPVENVDLGFSVDVSVGRREQSYYSNRNRISYKHHRAVRERTMTRVFYIGKTKNLDGKYLRWLR